MVQREDETTESTMIAALPYLAISLGCVVGIVLLILHRGG